MITVTPLRLEMHIKDYSLPLNMQVFDKCIRELRGCGFEVQKTLYVGEYKKNNLVNLVTNGESLNKEQVQCLIACCEMVKEIGYSLRCIIPLPGNYIHKSEWFPKVKIKALTKEQIRYEVLSADFNARVLCSIHQCFAN